MKGQMTGIPFGIVTYDEPRKGNRHKRKHKKGKWYEKVFWRK